MNIRRNRLTECAAWAIGSIRGCHGMKAALFVCADGSLEIRRWSLHTEQMVEAERHRLIGVYDGTVTKQAMMSDLADCRDEVMAL